MFKCEICNFELFNPVASLKTCSVGLYDDNRFPGRCIVSLSKHHENIAFVPATLRNEFLDEIFLVGRVLQTTLNNVCRINYAVLGNAESHVHAHVIPRFLDNDPIPHSAPWQHPLKAQTLGIEERTRLVQLLAEALKRNLPSA